jgi:hypothetical protein
MKFSSSVLESVSVRGLREEDSLARKVKENVMPSQSLPQNKWRIVKAT